MQTSGAVNSERDASPFLHRRSLIQFVQLFQSHKPTFYKNWLVLALESFVQENIRHQKYLQDVLVVCPWSESAIKVQGSRTCPCLALIYTESSDSSIEFIDHQATHPPPPQNLWTFVVNLCSQTVPNTRRYMRQRNNHKTNFAQRIRKTSPPRSCYQISCREVIWNLFFMLMGNSMQSTSPVLHEQSSHVGCACNRQYVPLSSASSCYRREEVIAGAVG